MKTGIYLFKRDKDLKQITYINQDHVALTILMQIDFLRILKRDEFGVDMLWQRLGQKMSGENQRGYDIYFECAGAIDQLTALLNP